MELSQGRTEAPQEARAAFLTTRWSVVLDAADSASPEAQSRALEALCRDYWYPLYAFLRRGGKSEADAKDLTQGFFEQLLRRKDIRNIRRDGGLFRSYLLTALKSYVTSEWRKETALKRGGDHIKFSIDADAEAQYGLEPVGQHTPETLFHRSWAFSVLSRVKDALSGEYQRAGKSGLYGALQGFLGGKPRQDAASYAEIGKRHGMSEAAITMAVKRMRHRYGELLRLEISQTVASPEEIDEEIQFLIRALAT